MISWRWFVPLTQELPLSLKIELLRERRRIDG